MKITLNSLLLLIMPLCIISCNSMNTSTLMKENTILELTTFNINTDINPADFAVRDEQVESDFTSKQQGFIKRQSGVDDKGNYVVVVY